MLGMNSPREVYNKINCLWDDSVWIQLCMDETADICINYKQTESMFSE